jgi:UDP-glucose 4-epimerase
MVVPSFVQAAIRDEPIRVFGDGDQTRCFTYVGDAVRAVVALMATERAVGEVFNVGSSEEISINELAHRVRTLSDSSSPIVHIPYEETYGPGFEDMRRRTPDISKIQRAINFRPSHGVDDILHKVIAYYRKQEHAVHSLAVNGNGVSAG